MNLLSAVESQHHVIVGEHRLVVHLLYVRRTVIGGVVVHQAVRTEHSKAEANLLHEICLGRGVLEQLFNVLNKIGLAVYVNFLLNLDSVLLKVLSADY